MSSVYNGYFPDLEQSVVDTLPCANVKASPSINSPNDGSFNSEENLKWTNKKLSQKPFIVGDTPEDVRNQFSIIENNGDSVKITGGLFSDGGYLFNINNTETISYDKSSTDSTLNIDTQHIVKFIENFTNQGTSDALSSNLNNYLFTEYRTDLGNEQYTEKWLSACVNDYPIGFITEKYTGDFQNVLSITYSGHVPYQISYGNNTIGAMYYTQFETPDDIRSSGRTTAFGCVQSGVVYDLHYPLYLKMKRVLSNDGYEDKIFVCYTDIFGMWHYFDECPINSRTYPATNTLVTDMTENKPLSGFNDTIKTTYPKNIYDYTKLYYDPDEGSVPNERYTKDGPLSTDILPENVKTQSITPGVSKPFGLFNDIFDVYDFSNSNPSLNVYVPQGSVIQSVRTTLSYFCIPSTEISSGDQLVITNMNGDSQTIPVAFMTSDGKLCPNGFVYYNESTQEYTTNNTYPVEGYLHWIKRLYLKDVEGETQPTESEIADVTVQKLIKWVSFASYYAIVFKYISMYMQVCYSSLLDNVIYTNGANDYLNIKFNGCGVRLSQSNMANITVGEFYVDQTYTTTDATGSSFTTVLSYHKDISSDKHRVGYRIDCKMNGEYVIVPSTTTRGAYYVWNTAPELEITYDGTDYDVTLLGIEDPISYIKRCTGYSSDPNSQYTDRLFDNSSGVAKMFRIDITNNQASLVECNFSFFSDIYSTSSIPPTILDDYLMPMAVDETQTYYYDVWLTTKVEENYNTEDTVKSIINGMNFCWTSYGWRTCIPYIIELQYDALGYLRGNDIESVSDYKGIKMFYRFPADMTNKDFSLFNVVISNIQTNENYDKESCVINDSTMFEETNQEREAYIHGSKIFDLDISSSSDQIINAGIVPTLVQCISFLWGDYNIEETKIITHKLKDLDPSYKLTGNITGSLGWSQTAPQNGLEYPINIPTTYKLIPQVIQTQKCFRLDDVETYTVSDNTIMLAEDTPNLWIYPSSVKITDSNNNVYTDNNSPEYTVFRRSKTSDILDSSGLRVGAINYSTKIITWDNSLPTLLSVKYSRCLVTNRQSSSELTVVDSYQNRLPVGGKPQYSYVTCKFNWDKIVDGFSSVQTYADLMAVDTSTLDEGEVYTVVEDEDKNAYNTWYMYTGDNTWEQIFVPQNVYTSLLVFAVNETKLPSYTTSYWDEPYSPI